MKLIESYALQCGAKIGTPFLLEGFYPLGFDKFITIQNSSGMGSKNYGYWQDVVDFIYPLLEEKGIKIVQIGDNSSPPLAHTVNLCGKTSLHQTNYILKRSLMHVGNDSFAVHLAAIHKVPVVGVYGPTSKANHSPYFYNKDRPQDLILIESHRNGHNPTYASSEPVNTINLIYPEIIAKKICNHFNLQPQQYEKTLYVGDKYPQSAFQIIPDFVFDAKVIQGAIATIRCDYYYDEDVLYDNLRKFPYSIVTDVETDIQLYNHVLSNIKSLNLKVSLDTSLSYARSLMRLKTETRLWSDATGEELSQIRLKLMDIGHVHHKITPTEVLGIPSPDTTFYKSNYFTFSKGKVFLSKTAWEEDSPVASPHQNFQKIPKNILDFSKEIDYCRIYDTKT